MGTESQEINVAEPLFVTQSQLETWIDNGSVTFDDGVLTLVAEQAAYKMVPAVRILSLLDGEDVQGWLGRVCTVEELEQQGAEHLHDSVIAGDTAYQCEPGFVGHGVISAPPSESKKEAGSPGTESTEPAAQPAGAAESLDDVADLLTDFLLKHLD